MKLFLASLLLLTVVVAGSFWWWTKQLEPTRPGSTETISVIIPKNQPAGATVEELVQKGLIRSSLVAKIYLKVTQIDQKIQPGSYDLSPADGMQALLLSLTKGPKDIWVTIPEGWRREQIGLRFDANLNRPDKTFALADFMRLTTNLEGQLFPDTYLVPTNISAPEVVTLMTDNFATKTKLTLFEQKDTLILASLLEREARTPAERPVIAGILWKRLKAGWPLNVDATIQYVTGNDKDWWPTVTNTHYPSLYNTYLHAGLPPTPISNPGLANIEAAKNPTPSDYWFYLHDNSGQVYYAKTLEEHNANVAKYLK